MFVLIDFGGKVENMMGNQSLNPGCPAPVLKRDRMLIFAIAQLLIVIKLGE